MSVDLDAIGSDLQVAYGRFLRQRARRRHRRLRLTAIVAGAACVTASAALAGARVAGFPLDPTEWAILGGGDVDGGRGSYVHAQNRADGSHSTFMVERDDGLQPYEAFLLHQRVIAAANETSPVQVRREAGNLCTPDELTRAERLGLATLAASFTEGAQPDATAPAVTAALAAGFAGSPCIGLEWAGERARFVYAGVEPRSMLMPGARSG